MPSILLSSTVIGIIITGAYSFFQFQKANSLKCITEERKKWREEIRKIMEEIEKSEKNFWSVGSVKARINAYGLYKEMVYEKDAHIWWLIAVMEKQQAVRNESKSYWKESDGNEVEYDENKKLLLKFLSLLLKVIGIGLNLK